MDARALRRKRGTPPNQVEFEPVRRSLWSIWLWPVVDEYAVMTLGVRFHKPLIPQRDEEWQSPARILSRQFPVSRLATNFSSSIKSVRISVQEGKYLILFVTN